jgi:hypothetical protein
MADGITLTGAATEGARQFQGLFTAIPFKLTFEDDTIATDSIYSGGGTVSVPGAAIGDFVLVAPVIDPTECQFIASVTADDTVEVTLVNDTAGTVTTFASGTVVNGIVLKPRSSVWDAIATS